MTGGRGVVTTEGVSYTAQVPAKANRAGTEGHPAEWGEPLYVLQFISPNLGDALNLPLVGALSGMRVQSVPYETRDHFLDRTLYAVSGSVLGWARRNTVVWGAGLVSHSSRPKEAPRSIHAVRGPLSRRRLLEVGLDCPEVYGDPALLLPRLYRPRPRGPGRLGGPGGIALVPNHIDREAPAVLAARDRGLRVIDVHAPILDVIDAICSSDFVLASSLHALIVADAYGIPSHWVKISDRILGGTFKFADYYASQHDPEAKPFMLSSSTGISELECLYREPRSVIDTSRLLEACPFHPPA